MTTTPETEIIPIPSTFVGRSDQKGINNPKLPPYHFKLVKREGKVCIWEKSRGGRGHATYEVVILVISPLRRFPDGSVSLPHESMPSAETWGLYGFSMNTLAEANRRFDKLVKTFTQ